jgi:O-antigen/teichoic acid export membrane protein
VQAGPALMTLAIVAPQLLTNMGSMTHALIVHPDLRPQRQMKLSVLVVPLRHGALLALISIGSAATYVFDNVLTLHWLGTVAAAQMALALRICFTANNLLISATNGIWPAFVEATTQGDMFWARRALLRGTAVTLSLALGGCALICLGGNRLLSLWLHQNFALPSLMFTAITCWIVAFALPRVPSLLLTAMHRYRVQFFLIAVATPSSFVAKYIFAKMLGVSGVLIGTALAWGLLIVPCSMVSALNATSIKAKVESRSRR